MCSEKINSNPNREKSGSNRLTIEQRGAFSLISFKNARQVKPNEFKDIFSENEIKNDNNYVSRTEQLISQNPGEEDKLAEIFEWLFVTGVQRGNWLGQRQRDQKPDFGVDAWQAARYDDLSHKIDAYVTVDVTEPDEECELPQVVFGVDVTTANSPRAIFEKLTKSYNGNEERPFGFSKIKYHLYKGQHTSKDMVPRYVIGLNRYKAKEFLDSLKTSKDRSFNFASTPENIISRFEILSEIDVQNQLLCAVLPDEDDANFSIADKSFGTIDRCLHGALRETIDIIMRVGKGAILEDSVYDEARRAYDEHQFSKTRNIIEGYLMKKSRISFQKGLRKDGKEGRIFNSNSDNDDTFCQIMECTRKLIEAARGGKLDNRRATSVRNKGFYIDSSGNVAD